MQKTALSHGQSLGNTCSHQDAFRKTALGSSRKQLLCLCSLRQEVLVDGYHTLPALFLEKAASTAAIKSPRNGKPLAACFITLCFVFQSLAVVCLSNAVSALLLIPYKAQKIIVQGKRLYLLECIMKRTAVCAALFI